LEGEQRDQLAANWASIEVMPAAENFIQLLHQLTRSADFHDAVSARYLAARVQLMFDAMLEDAELCDQLLENAIVENCADNATVRFSDLEVRLLVWQVEHGAAEDYRERALLHLGGQLWRLDQVKRLAWEYAHSLENHGQEVVEVELALCIALRGAEDLDLPFNFNGMLFPTVANVEPEVIVRVRNEVLDAQTEAALAVSLVERSFWKQYLTNNFNRRLRVPQSFRDEYQALEDRQATVDEQDELQARVNRHEYETLLAITHELLAKAAQ
jgi:hypothetical protein